MLVDYSATIRRLFQTACRLFRVLPCDYPATIVPLVVRSSTGPRRFCDTGDSGRRGSGSCCKTPGDALRRRARRGMFKGVSIPGGLRRVLNTLYLRRKRPVFAFYGFRYIGILPRCKNAVYARKWGYFEGCRNTRALTPNRTQKKAPRRLSPPGELRSSRGKEKPRSASGAFIHLLFFAAPSRTRTGRSRIYRRIIKRSPPYCTL